MTSRYFICITPSELQLVTRLVRVTTRLFRPERETMQPISISIDTATGDSIVATHAVVVTHAYLIVQDRTKADNLQLADISREDAIKLRDWLDAFIKYSA